MNEIIIKIVNGYWKVNGKRHEEWNNTELRCFENFIIDNKEGKIT